jgi:hypothetical protein
MKKRPIVHPVPPSQSAKRKRELDPVEDPQNFIHVRIRTKKRRRNKDEQNNSPTGAKRCLDDPMDFDMEIASFKRIKYNGTDKNPHTAGGTNVPKSVEVEQSVKPKWDPSQYGLDFNAMAGC